MFEKHIENLKRLTKQLGRPARFMEVCGTHTMAAFRSGLRSLLPDGLSLLSGPGCPVCVTPDSYMDMAVAIAQQPNVLVTTFGDMLRVPGTESSLEKAKAGGSQVRIVYSPLDALQEAQKDPNRRVVFLGVGFETTAPTIGWTIKAAAEAGVKNYSVLCAHKTMPYAMAALLAGGVRVDGFICPGHVSAVIGAKTYDFICRDYGIPCVVAGFEAGDMAESMEMLLQQLIDKRAEVEIQYRRTVTREGNTKAQALLAEVFEECEVEWRGVGNIPRSGLRIRDKYAAHDADKVFAGLPLPTRKKHTGCRCGEVLRGVVTPLECPLFSKRCTPTTPVGACMVSSEGTCAAYFRYAKTGVHKPT